MKIKEAKEIIEYYVRQIFGPKHSPDKAKCRLYLTKQFVAHPKTSPVNWLPEDAGGNAQNTEAVEFGLMKKAVFKQKITGGL